MKFYYITNSRIPTEKAHGLQIIKMCEAFSSAGANLELVLPTRKNKNFEQVDIYSYYQVEKKFKITKLKTFDPLFLLKLKSPAGTFIKIQTLFFSWNIYRYLKKQSLNPEDIIYTRDQYLIPVLLRFSKNVFWEAHNLPKNRAQYANFWKKCPKVIAITQGLKDDLVSLGLNSNSILVAPDGVDLKIFSPTSQSIEELRKDLNLPKDKKIVLYTGHLYDWKGAQVLARAAQYMGPEVMVIFLGGNYRAIEKFKLEFSNQQNILILGRVPHSAVPAYLQAADVLVLPNSGKEQISARYTSPLKLFEYMAVQKPIVASALPSIKEILSNNNSVLVEPDSPPALARGISMVLNDKSLAEKISQQAKQDVLQYSWDNRVKNIIKFI